jgi:hypothetical protein
LFLNTSDDVIGRQRSSSDQKAVKENSVPQFHNASKLSGFFRLHAWVPKPLSTPAINGVRIEFLKVSEITEGKKSICIE